MTNDNNDFVQYQSGVTSVDHRNIDAAGDDHPFGDEPRSFEADLRHLIRKVADDLYPTWQATVREYEANGETACLKVQDYVDDPASSPFDDMIVSDSYQPKMEIEWNKQEDKLIIQDNGIGMAAREVDEIFRQIGHSASRDDGSKSGAFGMGALSFVKLVGLDNAMIMISHSRLNDDNAAYYVTLAGVEPIQGKLPDDQYGTKFIMNPDDDYNIRQAVETYSEWMRVPVRYEEIGEDGEVEFQEDYGNKTLFEQYPENALCLGVNHNNAYEAYTSPESNSKTLLLSMEIDRNDGDYSPGRHGSPFPFDIRLLDESGKVVESTNGNEGLIPTTRGEYEQMLVEARDPYISDEMLKSDDVVATPVVAGPNEGKMVIDEALLNSAQPVPANYEYITHSDVEDADEAGDAQIILGPNQGKTIVSDEEWDDMDEGRAALYVVQEELEDYDLGTGEGDLTLPKPTSDRERLQEHETFWEYIGKQFGDQFDQKVDELHGEIINAPDPIEKIVSMDAEDFVINPAVQQK